MGASLGRDEQVSLRRWRRLVAGGVVAAVVALLPVVAAPAAHADGDRGREAGWSEPDSRQRWGREFRSWATDRPVLRREVRHLVRSDWAERRDANGAGIDVALVDTGIAGARPRRPRLVVNGPDLSLDRQAGLPPAWTYGHGTHMASLHRRRRAWPAAPGWST
ncbi:MAG: hypothetical protein H6518_02830 [Microthrixaceae bacterium]|nr:hypothetical protein [Microthrixaceae bacterium]